MKKKIKAKNMNRPIIESLINTAALAITSYGVLQITTGNPKGYIGVLFGIAIEYFKYWGRLQELW